MTENTQEIMGIEIFKWDGWDALDAGQLQFYEVEFLLPELEKYNGSATAVSLDMNGDLEFYDEKGGVLDLLNIGSLVSFRDALHKLNQKD